MMKIKNYRDRYNSLKWWQVKRDGSYHYYLQQFIGVHPGNWRASSKMFRVRKSWIESVLNEVVVF